MVNLFTAKSKYITIGFYFVRCLRHQLQHHQRLTRLGLNL